jgi:glycosyltransferase involved in cell wall biosynthesis
VAGRLAHGPAARFAYAYEDAAEETFIEAGRLGWRRAYDLPILYAEAGRRLLEEEALRYPEWEPTLVGTRDSAWKTERKRRELALADVVVCPSKVVADSLPADIRADKRVVVAPFGSPPTGPPPLRRPVGPLRVLFAGSLSQRKGLADLVAAMKLLHRGDVDLIALGSPVADAGFYRRIGPGSAFEPPRPHSELLEFMRTCDLLCLPSIVEGRALVVQEAMSQGLPVIVTPQTGADDLVTEGVNGFVVPMRAPGAIAEKLDWCADHRDLLPEMGRASQAAAALRTWEDYGAKVLAGLDSN